MNNLENQIEAVLFFKAEPLSIERLANILDKKQEEILNALNTLEESLKNRGLTLMQKDDEYTLAVNKENSDIIEKLRKEELNKELSKSALETLSIILYRNGATRSEIDFIRGVNSSFTLRALSIRGLVEKTTNKEDSRKLIYKPTFELLSFMGISKVEELPNFEDVNKNLENTILEINKEEN